MKKFLDDAYAVAEEMYDREEISLLDEIIKRAKDMDLNDLDQYKNICDISDENTHEYACYECIEWWLDRLCCCDGVWNHIAARAYRVMQQIDGVGK